jgi:replicative DNA helicase
MRDSLENYDGSDRIVSQLQKIVEIDNLPPVNPIYTGFKVLDEWIQGMVQGELWILSGEPKSGKSTMMKTFLRNMSNNKEHAVVFSFEEQTRYFLESFENKAKDLLFYMPNEMVPYSVDWVCERAREAKDKVNAKVIFIDHGHYLFEMSSKQNGALDIGDCARKLKLLATSEDLVVVLLWHIRKHRIESIDDLDMELLRDTGMLAGEMDGLIFTHREVKSDGVSQIEESFLKVDRTRRSGVFKRVIPVKKEGAYFQEMGIDI